MINTSPEKTCYNLMDQCSTGTTSHQHSRSPHQPPGHDLVIDLKQGQGKYSAHRRRLGQQHAGQATVAVPLGLIVGRAGSNPRPKDYESDGPRLNEPLQAAEV
jgi:hypothetical protein